MCPADAASVASAMLEISIVRLEPNVENQILQNKPARIRWFFFASHRQVRTLGHVIVCRYPGNARLSPANCVPLRAIESAAVWHSA
jgi:hypothetical protein